MLEWEQEQAVQQYPFSLQVSQQQQTPFRQRHCRPFPQPLSSYVFFLSGFPSCLLSFFPE